MINNQFAVFQQTLFNRVLSGDEISSLTNGLNITLTETSITSMRNPAIATLSIYPNPATEKIVFENSTESTQKAIYNLQGKKLMETHENSIAISHLSSGIYIVKFTQTDNQIAYGKFLKK